MILKKALFLKRVSFNELIIFIVKCCMFMKSEDFQPIQKKI
jgi:hypothetical protein